MLSGNVRLGAVAHEAQGIAHPRTLLISVILTGNIGPLLRRLLSPRRLRIWQSTLWREVHSFNLCILHFVFEIQIYLRINIEMNFRGRGFFVFADKAVSFSSTE